MSYFTDFSKIDLDKYYFDEVAANSAVRYIETHCYHVKGKLAGTIFKLADWQKERIIKPIFGWKHKELTHIKDADGKVLKSINRRKFTNAYIEVAKKNGKSTMLSAIAQIFMDIDPELGSEIVGIAWGRKQASIIFDMVEKSISKSPRMKDRIKHYKSTNVLLSNDGEKRYKVWSKEAGIEDGQFPQLVICDELHQHKNGEVLDLAERSQLGRVNPLSLVITTAGNNLAGIGYERRVIAEKVSNGIIIDESLLVCVFCADKEDDPYNYETWAKANPNLAIGFSVDDFMKYVTDSKKSPANLNAFKRFHLNIWINTKDQWMTDADWMSNQKPFDIKKLDGLPCFGGLDLSITSDFTAFALVFPFEDYYISLNWYWVAEVKGHQAVDERMVRDYRSWVETGLVVETPGTSVDYDYPIEKIKELAKQYKIINILYDKFNAHQVALKLEDAGVEVMEFSQRIMHMSPGTKEMQKLIEDRKFNHLGDPVLRWMMSNSQIIRDANDNIKVTKEDNNKFQQVDGIVANVMAVSASMDPKFKPSKSYLEDTKGELYVL